MFQHGPNCGPSIGWEPPNLHTVSVATDCMPFRIRWQVPVVFTVICRVHYGPVHYLHYTRHVYIQVLCIPFMQDGQNALHLAAYCGHVNTIHYLATKMESLLHTPDNNGYTVLHWAAQNGHANVVKLLLEDYNLDPNAHGKVSY